MKDLYAPLGRAAHMFATPFLRVYFVGRNRVRVVVLNERQEILLVRSWFGHQRWSLPGGGIRRREPPIEAAIRETFEETGVRIAPDHIKPLGQFKNGDSNAPFTVDCYTAHVSSQPAYIAARQRLEMLDVSWFPLAALPETRSTTVDNALKLAPHLFRV